MMIPTPIEIFHITKTYSKNLTLEANFDTINIQYNTVHQSYKFEAMALYQTPAIVGAERVFFYHFASQCLAAWKKECPGGTGAQKIFLSAFLY